MDLKDKNKERCSSRQDGIALIMVLGILSIMTLLAVSFAITMRTERLAAENYVYSVKARHLLSVAQARAIADVDEYLGDMLYPDFSFGGPSFRDVLISFGDKKPDDFLNCDFTNFIPNEFMAEAGRGKGHSDFGWEDIYDPADSSKKIGRFAYMVINCSGLLDASYVAGSNRMHGLDPHEIRIRDLPGMNPIKEDEFVEARTSNWIRFENMAEIKVAPAPTEGVFSYSRFTNSNVAIWRQSGSEIVTNKIRLDTSPHNLLQKQDEIERAFYLSGIELKDCSNVFWNLIDYLDEDKVPSNLLSCCTEPVPMINEIIFTNRLTLINPTGDIWQLDTEMIVETWFPFPDKANRPDFWLDPNFAIDINPADSSPAGFQPMIPPTLSVIPNKHIGDNYKPHSFQTNTFALGATNVSGLSSARNIAYNVRIRGLKLRTTEGVVDEIPQTEWLRVLLTGMGFSAGTRNYQWSLEITDPRVNFMADQWIGQSPPTLGKINRNLYTGGMGERYSPMYVRNNWEKLESVAELGYLSIGKPWSTIRLYQESDLSKPYHRILDYFTVGTGGLFKGQVNINSRVTNAVAAVYNGVPVEAYPGEDPPCAKLTWDESKTIAKHLMFDIEDEGLITETNLSRIGAMWQTYDRDIRSLTNDALKESVLRNTHQLFGVRQNLFTILMAAQVVDDSDTVFAEQRAVAVVWRDPVADDSGKHPCFVKYFKLLAE